MLNIGPQELLLILVVALLVVGPKRLPELARSLGKGIRELRKAQEEVTRTIRVNLDDEPRAASRTPGRTLPETPEPSAEGPADSTDAPPAHPTPAPSEVAEISKTLGRGLAELRRARQEIQESFRVDLDDRPARPPARPEPATPTGEEPAAGEPSSE